MALGICNAEDYRRKVEYDLGLFLSAIDDPYAGINAFTSTYHLHEWLWRYNVKPKKPSLVRGFLMKDYAAFKAWLETDCPNFRLIREITNGSKHATPVHNGGIVEGFGSGPFGIGPFGQAYLLIDRGKDHGDDRFCTASRIVQEGAAFLLDLAKELGA